MFKWSTKPFSCCNSFFVLRVNAPSLDVTRVFTGTISEEFKELQRLYSCKNDEHEGVVLKLQSQLISACDELDKISRTLRTLQGVDGHGLSHSFI